MVARRLAKGHCRGSGKKKKWNSRHLVLKLSMNVGLAEGESQAGANNPESLTSCLCVC